MKAMKRSSPARHWQICLILALFVVTAVIYSVYLPLGEASDETDHFALVRFIADAGRPPLTQLERQSIGPKGDASPIYHSLVAVLSQHVDVSSLPQLLDAQAHPERFIATDGFRANRLFHTEDESLPFHGIVLAWHLGRLISIPLGAATVLAVYLTVLQIYPDRRNFAAAAAGFAGFVPRFVIASAVINDDNLMTPLTAFALYFMVRLVRGDHRRRTAFLVGLLAAGATVVKYHSLALVAEFTLLLIVLAWRRRLTWAAAAHLWGWALLAFFLIAGPWFAFILLRFNQVADLGLVRGLIAPLGDPVAVTGLGRLFDMSPGGAPSFAFGWTDWAVLFFRSFWIVYGWVQLFAPSGVYWALALVSLLAVFGLATAVFRHRRAVFTQHTPGSEDTAARSQRDAILLMAFHLALFLGITLLRYWMRPAREIGQGRYLYPALAPAALFFVLGLSEAWNLFRRSALPQLKHSIRNVRRDDGALALILGGSMLALSAVTLPLFILPHYKPYLPIRWTDHAAADVLRRESTQLAPGIFLAGKSLPPDSSSAAAGETLPVLLTWYAEKELERDYLEEICLIDDQETPVTCIYRYPVDGRYPTRAWESGYQVQDQVFLPTPASLKAGFYTMTLSLHPLRSDVAGAALDPTAAVKSTTLGTVTISESERAGQPAAVGTAGGSSTIELWQDQNRCTDGIVHIGMVRQSLTVIVYDEATDLAADATPEQPRLVSENGDNSGNDWLPAPIGQDGKPVTVAYRHPDGRTAVTFSFIAMPNVTPGVYHIQVRDEVFEQHEIIVDTRWRDFSPPSSIGQPTAATFGSVLRLLGYSVDDTDRWPGDTVDTSAYWQSLQVMPRHYLLNLYLTNPTLGVAGKLDWTLGGHYPNVLWAPDENVTEAYPVSINPEAVPGLYSLELSVRDYGRRLTAAAGDLQPLAIHLPGTRETTPHLVLAEIRVRDPREANLPQPSVSFHLGNQIDMVAYEVNSSSNPSPVSPGDDMAVTLFWKAVAQPTTDYTVFVQLIGPDGLVWAQKDNQPQAGGYPTSRWDLQNTVVDRYNLVLKPDIPAGIYTLMIGMYDLETGQRLSVSDSSAQPVPGDAIPVTQIEVAN